MSNKIKSLEELRKIKQQVQEGTEIREKGQNIENMIEVKVSMATCGIASGAREVMAEMIEEAKKRGLNNVVFTQCGCMGFCHSEPTIMIARPGEEPVIYGNVKGTDRIREIFDHVIEKGEMVDGLIPTSYRTSHE
ncbi:MAG: (2Fe-2S) ferredoxin domain-containing protein [Thermanaerothrix sp.]|nr:(2Fe-2S) ferredoxin domain-containing protein [Thermanaerothrix sp.]